MAGRELRRVFAERYWALQTLKEICATSLVYNHVCRERHGGKGERRVLQRLAFRTRAALRDAGRLLRRDPPYRTRSTTDWERNWENWDECDDA